MGPPFRCLSPAGTESLEYVLSLESLVDHKRYKTPETSLAIVISPGKIGRRYPSVV